MRKTNPSFGEKMIDKKLLEETLVMFERQNGDFLMSLAKLRKTTLTLSKILKSNNNVDAIRNTLIAIEKQTEVIEKALENLKA